MSIQALSDAGRVQEESEEAAEAKGAAITKPERKTGLAETNRRELEKLEAGAEEGAGLEEVQKGSCMQEVLPMPHEVQGNSQSGRQTWQKKIGGSWKSWRQKQ